MSKLLGLLIILMSCNLWAVKPQISSLEKSYQKELLFLQSHKRELKKKLARVDEEMNSQIGQAKSQVRRLEQQWIKLQTDNEARSVKLSDLERESEQRTSSKDVLEMILGEMPIENKNTVAEITEALNAAIVGLSAENKPKNSAGSFYSESGKLIKGEVVDYGSNIKYGMWGSQAALLYPIGQGHFKVWKNISPAKVKSLLNGERVSSLPAFLFSDKQKAYSVSKDKSFMDTVRAGGLIGLVILVLGVLAGLLSFVRLKLLKAAEKVSVQRVSEKVSNALVQKIEKIDEVITEAIISETLQIDRFGAFILVIASVAPLLGLLGTVTGMIGTFDIITELGTGNPKMLSGGISEALVTTMFGLIVAIPVLLFGQFLNSWASKIKIEMEKVALAKVSQS